ncbi:uncharacterized protein FIESC28_11409 [Fusarium coffeatum]|uniref:Uncharacterized protein n=1 Tax=Fusarium coffeatum TaxID=231269 RepID=A0A366QJU4_9HYPO|nr:uncharacterized protein FIESC28_11409 [Fusarium coffeatum]RBR05199.1 hypothetical protein FIESC28_11409 [Fusarium coffeatum]
MLNFSARDGRNSHHTIPLGLRRPQARHKAILTHPTPSPLSAIHSQVRLPDTKNPIHSPNTVKTVSMTLWPRVFSKPNHLLHLYFGGCIYRDAVRAHIMWNFPDETESSYSSFTLVSTQPAECFDVLTPSSLNQGPSHLPIICYIARTQLMSNRNNHFRIAPGPGKSSIEPIFRLRELRARKLVPSLSDHNACFLGVFFGMAQKHFYPRPFTDECEFRMSPVILTHNTGTLAFIVYNGNITEAFLEKFHNPFKATPNNDDDVVSSNTIDYTEVPIWSILGLRELFGKVLCQEVVGAFQPE